MKDGFIRAAALTPEIKVADCIYNAERIIELAGEAAAAEVSMAVFPELCITAYTCQDLFESTLLLDKAIENIYNIIEATKH